MNRLVFVAFLAVIGGGCSREPTMCFHVDATPADDRALRDMAHRVGESISAKVKDLSDDEPTAENVSDVFVEVDGDGVDVVLAHQSMHPWICLYGERESEEVLHVKESFERELAGVGLKYTIEQR